MKNEDTHNGDPRGRRLFILSLFALGVVYGDIGTSPLYAMRECFFGEYGIEPTHANVLGVLSLLLWSLFTVVSLKYLTMIVRADNNGEGGILALMALARMDRGGRKRLLGVLTALGLFGAALLYGDGMITPAISVLSAVEGLKVATPFFEPYLVPITIGLLVGLFLAQRRGTAGLGAMFGPIMLFWFLVIGALGVRGIITAPRVLLAVNPVHAVWFFWSNGLHGFLVLGAVFLVVTGAEALYADMGHFGRRPIRMTWFALVLPSLLLNYFGQGALLLTDPSKAHNPFYNLAPVWMLYPLVFVAAIATIIASQAVISGAFSLTRQAMQLGYCPRLQVVHTSSEEIGQIYVPPLNWALMICTIGLVLGFGSSSRLAAAYGVAVTSTMVITSLLFYVVSRERWGWNRLVAGSVVAMFLVVDLAFFGANFAKIAHGAWFPLVIGGIVYVLMTTWRKGRQNLARAFTARMVALDGFLEQIRREPPTMVPGTAFYMTGNPNCVPPALMQNIKHNRVMHKQVIFLNVLTEEVPKVERRKRIEVEELSKGIYRMTLRFGFKEDPDVLRTLRRAQSKGLDIDMARASFFLGRERLFAKKKSSLSLWREKLFAFMSRNALGATAFYRIPPERVVELGSQVEL